jgi:hypothetical protein
VVSVLILPGWITVVKSPEASWATLKPKIEAIPAQIQHQSPSVRA